MASSTHFWPGAPALAWLLVERFRDGHVGTLAAAYGLVAGVVCALAVGLEYRWRYDDSLDVVGSTCSAEGSSWCSRS